MNYAPVPEGKDPQLWQIAVKRASFRRHLVTYLLVNGFLWILWLFSGSDRGGFPWPIWPTLGWGIGLASHYASAYLNTGKDRTEEEYEKLIQQNQNK